jgi:hypothetical protein
MLGACCTILWVPGTSTGRFFEALREKLVPALRNDSDARDRTEDLLRGASRLTDETMLRHSQREQLRRGHSARAVAVVCNAVATAFDRVKLVEVVQTGLPRIGVRRAVVVVYPPNAPRASALLTGYGIRAAGEAPGCHRFDRQLALPPDYDWGDTKGCHVVLPLAVGSCALGHVVLQHDANRS